MRSRCDCNHKNALLAETDTELLLSILRAARASLDFIQQELPGLLGSQGFAISRTDAITKLFYK